MAADGSGVEFERSADNAALLDTSFLDGANALYIEQMQAQYAENPASVPESWRRYFDSLGDAGTAQSAKAAKGASWSQSSKVVDLVDAATPDHAAFDGDWQEQAANGSASQALYEKLMQRASSAPTGQQGVDISQQVQDSIRAIMMIRAYRIRGHLAAKLDPLGIESDGFQPELEPQSYGFGPEDMDRPIFIDMVLGLEYATVREMLEILRRTYCSTFGVEFMHISNPEEKSWIQERIEGKDKEISFTAAGKIAILKKLIETEGLERFLHKRYPGTKRFGIDGGEAMVPALEQIIKRGGALGIDEIVIGMPHRGRLNVLSAVMGKPYHVIFNEFMGGNTQGADEFGSGDVKYHLGASSDRTFDDNKVHLSLTANPSHLEAVNPVVIGKARAKQAQDQLEDSKASRTKVLPLLLHGDAAFAGQGVVAECFGLSGLAGYRTGGTIHFIVNNQIGFTTSPSYSRSSPYPSDVALMVQAPILHVNGDDPEAVTFATKIATEYRQKFAKDVVIDMFCYRRFGHNEGDEPMFTQPVMYNTIKRHPSTREIYAKRLIEEDIIKADMVDQMLKEFEDFLEDEFEQGKNFKANKADWLDGVWAGLGLPDGDERKGATAVDEERLTKLGKTITTIPDGAQPHRTLKRVFEGREKSVDIGKNIDWATAESLAFATLLDEGFPVRLSGQDSGRGTFSQRHSHIVDQKTGERYTPLNHICETQAHYEVIDSMLSEEAVLGFEYGYSLAAPNTLTLWEAQFGDFANGAQVVFDQFISSAERKWLRMSGLVCLLPHGYEGQGPEHSSARLERYLQLCAEDNMQVANCTTPANYFHILRRQIHRNFRKPLILMTPKSLLRHKKAVSSLKELATGSSFHRVLWDDADTHARKKLPEFGPGQTSIELCADKDIQRVVLCSGKVYYDLLEAREALDINNVYLMRVEQYYPAPVKSLLNEMKRFPEADVIWCQEEPRNMGAWSFIEPYIEWVLDQMDRPVKRPLYIGRDASASTATGIISKHKQEQEGLVARALDVNINAETARRSYK